MIEPRYPYVAVDVGPDEADEAGALLFELGAQGVEERDATTLVRGAAGKVTLVGSFEDEAAARSAIAELPAGWSARLEQVVGDAWRDEWKKHFEPFRICEGIVVRPPWRDYAPSAGEHVIELEPGRAFGTGLHETTRLVAEILAGRGAALAGSRVLDVGCGSGILSLVALALSAGAVRAVDVDPDAVAVTRENAARNGLSERVQVDETAVGALEERYATVLANIEAKTLVELAPALIERVAAGGLLVLSGILAPAVAPAQVEEVTRAFAALEVGAVRQMGEWVAIPLSSPQGSRRGAQ
ncbi:MAG TPA: 50S ribosomal protein L11 methyltransferase [Polyangiaceae bacterium]|jgi:ribosomal protein L11 methyltransferase|nr:50S ribosomal protein L11 methyltransferase [Polyangiaceae bacterium]